ncbi:hypothetical protein [Solirubrum puertoriconensis]|uniref:Uncharacterized protein n=1 Tax=Solirubrum puertoriconensis TaxID=1751427 RepID=A0A9X0HKI3_SOLP1|nr:hypothetical protein [Solirubrum puertoriconensis]KUG07609.1 hypothetical protein ASU33_14850 [Solirubrum puertoriconensis]
MQVVTQSAETVAKETIPTLRFPHEDVLPTAAEQKVRRFDAERACALGNNYHGKLDIYFQTDDGNVKRVQTTVWAVHESYITLKAGITIPLNAIIGFDFY